MQIATITTTDGTPFTPADSADLARLVYKRFGRDPDAATAAWRRMLGNSCEVSDFMALVECPETNG